MNNLHRITVAISGLVLGAGIAFMGGPHDGNSERHPDPSVPSASEAFQASGNARPAAEGNVHDMTY